MSSNYHYYTNLVRQSAPEAPAEPPPLKIMHQHLNQQHHHHLKQQQQQQHLITAQQKTSRNVMTMSPARIAISNSFARQQAQAHIEKVMNQIRNGSASVLRQQQQQETTNNSSSAQYKRLVESASYIKNTSNHKRLECGHLSQLNRYRNRDKGSDIMELAQKLRDPALIRWLQDIRFEPELEPLALQAKSCSHEQHSARALGIRYSQVSIQETRAESSAILDFIDHLIDELPLNKETIVKFHLEFSELYGKLVKLTGEKASTHRNTTTTQEISTSLTITHTTPKKSQAYLQQMRPLDKLTIQIRNLCLTSASLLYEYQEDKDPSGSKIDNGLFESQLRKLKELFGKFIEIFIRAECRNIVQGLQFDFSQMSLNKISSNSSLRPSRPFESSYCQLPLKWALIALWQLTKDDSYICRTLTERSIQHSLSSDDGHRQQHQAITTSSTPLCKSIQFKGMNSLSGSPNSKRLDYSTKYDHQEQMRIINDENNSDNYHSSIRHSDYQRLCELTSRAHPQQVTPTAGALRSALKSKEPTKEASTIELLIEIIISQPNKHERLDMIKYMEDYQQQDVSQQQQQQQQHSINLEQWDQSLSAAIYTSNQFKVAALRILNHLCINEQAVKTILRCFSTPPPSAANSGSGRSQCSHPENKIIRSIFECYQTTQEHIYQNEAMFEALVHRNNRLQNGFKRPPPPSVAPVGGNKQLDAADYSDYSDYGSKGPLSSLTGNTADNAAKEVEMFDCAEDFEELEQQDSEGEDAVVREAIRLIVQLTSSFHRTNQGLDYYTLIGRFSVESIVKYLTNIIKSQTSSRELILLSLSALANISFISTEPIKRYSTNRVILDMFRSSNSRSKDLELRDQAVTILANAAEKNSMDLISNGALSFLMSCLESCPTRMASYSHDASSGNNNLENIYGGSITSAISNASGQSSSSVSIEKRPRRDRKPIDFGNQMVDLLDCSCEHGFKRSCSSKLSEHELAALERIHQKTAVAFARMSGSEPSIIKMVLEYGGVKKMIELCKFGQRRNYSDTVLIAAIAALRKMAKVLDRDTFKNYNALDLIELEFDQTLEIYGNSRNEVGSEVIYSTEV